jgi:GTP 3',8-cyclase
MVAAAAAAAAGDVAAIALRIDEAWAQKPDGSTFRGCTEASAAGVSMRQVGG